MCNAARCFRGRGGRKSAGIWASRCAGNSTCRRTPITICSCAACIRRHFSGTRRSGNGRCRMRVLERLESRRRRLAGIGAALRGHGRRVAKGPAGRGCFPLRRFVSLGLCRPGPGRRLSTAAGDDPVSPSARRPCPQSTLSPCIVAGGRLVPGVVRQRAATAVCRRLPAAGLCDLLGRLPAVRVPCLARSRFCPAARR